MSRLARAFVWWLILVAAAVAILTSLPYGVEFRPPNPGTPLIQEAVHRAEALATYGASHRCHVKEPYPPHDEQRSALVEVAPGVIRLVGIDEGRAILSGQAPGTLLAVCERPTEGAMP
jgi:hypothetical protein